MAFKMALISTTCYNLILHRRLVTSTVVSLTLATKGNEPSQGPLSHPRVRCPQNLKYKYFNNTTVIDCNTTVDILLQCWTVEIKNVTVYF